MLNPFSVNFVTASVPPAMTLSINPALISRVPNIMELAEEEQAVLRVVRKSLMPGEKVEVTIVKTGKEHGQGIA